MDNCTPPSEMTVSENIRKIAKEAKVAVSEMATLPRWLHIFWLTGPLILLIERSPADFWLTICALSFLVRSILIKDFNWLKVFWVRAVFVFWGVCLLSAISSDLPVYSLGEAFIWIRFPLFAMASCFWLAVDKRLLYAMLSMTMLGMIIMTGILTAEILIVGQQGGRLSWPYGDLVPGNYLAKTGMPAFCVLVALAVSNFKQTNSTAALISGFTIMISVFTGERINFLIRACGGMLAGLLWRPKLSRYAFLIIFEILLVASVFFVSPNIGNRFVDSFVQQLPNKSESPYFRVMNSGVIAFESSPILGVGSANYRILCADLVSGYKDAACHTHPHNFYIQLLAETGIVGFVFGCIMLGSITWNCAQTTFKGRHNILMATAVVMPFGLFFPIQSTADFFGQWNNIFMWSAVAIALSTRNLLEQNKRV